MKKYPQNETNTMKTLEPKDPSSEQLQSIINLYTQGQLQEALFHTTEMLEQFPNSTVLFNFAGASNAGLMQFNAAIDNYKQALKINPNYAEAFFNMGVALKDKGDLEAAIDSYKQAIKIKPDYTDAFFNMGVTLEDKGDLKAAIDNYKQALKINPDYQLAMAQKLYLQAMICDWAAIEEDRDLIQRLGTLTQHIGPFTMLALEDVPESHRLRSEAHAKSKYLQKPLPPASKPSQKPKRLRIGYFSADFHNHATMYLLSKVFELHDKRNFEVYAYSYGSDKNDHMRQNLVKSVSVCHDVRKLSDKDVVELARQDKIDIAVDLKGYTKGQRLGLFSYRLAPIQISYLGYPGTLGTEFIDYLIADPIVIPRDKQHFYSEEVIYLPYTYQPNDNTREIAKTVTTRSDFCLPEEGFVFCSFNNNYKISSVEFDIWMRLLSKVEGSVLWLLKSNEWAEKNLRREAEKRGIKADRLVFAEKLLHNEHLARHKFADIFLDTFNYNAHTTTSDALWSGLPVVTKLGKGFAARVSGSLLTAIDLTELITETVEDYEALILDLSTNPERLSIIRQKLADNRLSKPLFNTELYTKHLEDAYQQVYQRYFEEKEPKVIYVSKTPQSDV